MEQIDLYKYFAGKGIKTGRPRFDSVKLLKIILFAFMENGYASLRNIEKLYKKIMQIDNSSFVYGSGKRKTTEQKHYEKLEEYLKKLKTYARHIKVCGDDRNSYSKTDNDATFMRIKKDYMIYVTE